MWLVGPALDQLLKTVALQSLKQTLTSRSSYWQRVSITLRYLESGNVFEGMKFSFSTCSLWTLRSTIVSIINRYCAILPTYNWHCAILSTGYSMDIAQYRPLTIQWFWDCTIQCSCIWVTIYCEHLQYQKETVNNTVQQYPNTYCTITLSSLVTHTAVLLPE
jgi:hypothetical protein